MRQRVLVTATPLASRETRAQKASRLVDSCTCDVCGASVPETAGDECDGCGRWRCDLCEDLCCEMDDEDNGDNDKEEDD